MERTAVNMDEQLSLDWHTLGVSLTGVWLGHMVDLFLALLETLIFVVAAPVCISTTNG